MKKRIIAIVLSMAMLLTFMPTMVFAAVLPDETGETEWWIEPPEESIQLYGGGESRYYSCSRR